MRFFYSSKHDPSLIEEMCRFVGPRAGQSFDPKDTTGITAIAERDGVVTGKGVVLYTHYDPGIDIFMSAAGEGNWLTRESLNVFFRYPFRELKVRRVSVLVAKKNRKSRTLVEKLGFIREGCRRKATPSGDNQLAFGLLASECRWLKEVDDGKRVAA